MRSVIVGAGFGMQLAPPSALLRELDKIIDPRIDV